MLCVDDRLLTVVGPRMGPGRAERHALLLRKREQAPAALALAVQRIVQIATDAGDDLDLRADQLARDVLVQQLVALRDRTQLLKARLEFERPRMQDRKLLLHADGEIGRLGKPLGRPV